MTVRARWACRARTGENERKTRMNVERDPRRGQVRLPAFAEPAAAEWQAPEAGGPALAGQSGRARSVGIRQVRRMSNWTAAALIVVTGATTVALAHHAISVGAPAAAASSSSSGVTTVTTQGASGPQVSHSVATTSASGVTTTTTSQVMNGKTVVSQVRHAPAYHDN
jgi:hypothetical protein